MSNEFTDDSLDQINNDELFDENVPTHPTEVYNSTTVLGGMYKDWFLEYASYVILERAVPHINDGLKPVQRRILHAMKRLDDGRYNKVANIIGHAMQFHPHGDASIGEALVQLGQKDLLIDCQGNWGNILTGDSAAAPRYIEARLSKFANEVVFNPKTTQWKLSYDGRNKEPITLPVKFPLLLAQGVEGIAVGLASKILPHNFNELIDCSIAYLQGKPFELYPDFPTGGMADVSKYNDGQRGGIVRVRAKIQKLDKKTLVITEIPFGKTTSTLIDSILKANEKGKIKIRKIDDNTAENVEILVHLQPGVSPDITIDALYAFTDCEISISPNCCVIDDEKPRFLGVSEILKINTDNTLNLLQQELRIKLAELEEDWHLSSLEKIFFEQKIYRELEKDAKDWEAILNSIEKAFEPYKNLLKREITRNDIIKLTEKPVRRISKFDIKKADEYIKSIEKEIKEVNYHLNHIVEYTINWYTRLKEKYGQGRERKTELRSFETIQATAVVANNEKLYVNRAEGFIGTSLKKEEYVCDCSDIDDILIILQDGTYLITKVAEKTYVGKNILYAGVFRKNDTRTIFNLVYLDGKTGINYVKRFAITGLQREKVYNLTQGSPHSKILYLTVNPNGEAETIKIKLKPKPRLKTLELTFNFSTINVKGKNAIGNILTRYAIHKIELIEKGQSTLRGTPIWYDREVNRLNSENKGEYVGEFNNGDKLLVVRQSGFYYLTTFDLATHFEDDVLYVQKFNPNKVYTVVYFDAQQQYYYLKRFRFESSEKSYNFVDEDNPDSRLILISSEKYPQIKLIFGGKHKNREAEIIDAHDFIAVKSFRAKGKRLTTFEIAEIIEIEPIQKNTETLHENSNNDIDNYETVNLEDIEKKVFNSESEKIIQPKLF